MTSWVFTVPYCSLLVLLLSGVPVGLALGPCPNEGCQWLPLPSMEILWLGKKPPGCWWNSKKSDPAYADKSSSVSNLFTKLSPDLVKNTVCVLDLICGVVRILSVFCQLELCLLLHLGVAMWYTDFIFGLGEGEWVSSDNEYVWESQGVHTNILWMH